MPRHLGARIRQEVQAFLRRRGKLSFIRGLPRAGRLLDVGCGNDSPFQAKLFRPDLFYAGIDVCDHNQEHSPDRVADRYLLASPEGFADAIKNAGGGFDGVVSAHNLEHCLEPEVVLRAMVRALKPGGRLYLSFPCEESVDFPSREKSTLNFFDDKTHREIPSLAQVLEVLNAEGCRVSFLARRYRPALLFAIGLLLEPVARVLKRNMPGGSTWAFYGFETVIWASRES